MLCLADKVMIGIGTSIGLLLLYLLSPVLTPFFIAGLLAYLGDPLVNQIKQVGLPRTWAVVLVFIVLIGFIFCVLLVLIPLLIKQISILFNRIPDLLLWLQHHALPWLYAKLGIKIAFNLEDIKAVASLHWKEAENFARFTLRALSYSSEIIILTIVDILLVLVMTFYLLRDWDRILEESRLLLPRKIEPLVSQLARECNEALGAFFRGQLIVMLTIGIFYSIGLWLVGLDLALLIGITAGILTLVPYLGFILGLMIASIAAFFELQQLSAVFYVSAIFFIGHAFEAMWLTPTLVGDRIGLHPVAVIFAILVGGQLLGFIGVLIALPVAAMLMVLLRYGKQRYIESNLYTYSR